MLIPTFYLERQDPMTGGMVRTPTYRARSFVQQFLRLLFTRLTGTTGSYSITDYRGTGVTQGGYFTNLSITSPGRGGAGQTYFNLGRDWPRSITSGIIVGSGTNAVAVTDFALQTVIPDGQNAGQLEYLTCAAWDYRVSGTTASFVIERLFRNSSGGNVTISEVGLYVSGNANTSVGVGQFCIVRDLVSPTFTVNNGQYLRVVYTMTITV